MDTRGGHRDDCKCDNHPQFPCSALAQAELVATLQGDGPFTVFAPTDDAFALAGIDLEALDTDEGKETP